MKNREKYAEELLNVACTGNRIAIDKQTMQIRGCEGLPCGNCLFSCGDCDTKISFIDPEHLRHSGELTFSEVDVINMLNHAPTAFDVDKVVEMLEEECFSPIDYPGYAVDIEKAIEIVEEGGKEC